MLHGALQKRVTPPADRSELPKVALGAQRQAGSARPGPRLPVQIARLRVRAVLPLAERAVPPPVRDVRRWREEEVVPRQAPAVRRPAEEVGPRQVTAVLRRVQARRVPQQGPTGQRAPRLRVGVRGLPAAVSTNLRVARADQRARRTSSAPARVSRAVARAPRAAGRAGRAVAPTARVSSARSALSAARDQLPP